MVEFVICGVNIYKWINYVYVIIKQGIEFIQLVQPEKDIIW